MVDLIDEEGGPIVLIVITGAQGFLGQRVVAGLAEAGHQILAVDRKPMIGHPVEGVIYHVSDLTDPDTLIPPECEPVGAFGLVHLAWDMRRPESAYYIQSQQVTLLAGLLDSWCERGLQFLVVPGSAQEYGSHTGKLSEDLAGLEPLTPYGWAKNSAYKMAVSWSKRTEIDLLWLRPFIVYGAGQAGNMLIPYAIRQAISGQHADFTDASQWRDFVHIDDVATAIIEGVSQPRSGVHTINLGSGKATQVRSVLERIGESFGMLDHFHFGAIPRRPGEPEEQVAEIIRAKEILHWTPTIAWEAGIDRLVREARS